MAVTGSGDERKVITSFGKFPHSAITILDSYVQGGSFSWNWNSNKS